MSATGDVPDLVTPLISRARKRIVTPILNTLKFIAISASASLIAFPLSASESSAPGNFEKDVRPILEKHCFKCHGPEKQKSDIRLDTLSIDLIKHRPDAETWHDVLNALNLGEMPPEDEPGLSSAERQVLTGWIDHTIELALDTLKSTGGEAILRRLNRIEYRNTMSDLLGIETDYDANLPPDTPSREGFKNNGAALSMSPLQLEYYLEAARKGLSHAIVTGPAPEKIAIVVTESDADKGKGNYTNRLGNSGTFVARLLEFPNEGEFVVKVRARAELVDGKGFPRLAARFGFRADTQTPSRELGIVDVSSEEIQEFEFRGRMEQFPLQSRTQSKYPGQLIWLSNVYTDGEKRPPSRQVESEVEVNGKKGKKQKKKKKTTEWIEYPDFPKVVIESVEFEGPVYESWPPEHHTRILPPSAEQGRDDLAYAEEVLSEFMRRAYRRPIEKLETKDTLQFFSRVRPAMKSFEEAIRETLAMVLVSPDFLYLIEPEDGKGKTPLSDFELASRLSYFIWSTMPDERLFDLAESGELRKPEVIGAAIDRMLQDPKSWQFVEQFSDQWLDLAAVDRVAVNPEYYPDWDNAVKPSMKGETQHFFAEILRNDLSALNFLDSDFTMLNEPLARHYGIENGPRGGAFESVALDPDDVRGGLLTQASVLLGNSTGEDSHPILRAVWIRDRLLDDPPADPPPNVPALDSENPDFAQLPVRKQLELHRQDPACNDCHRGIDPWGIALEQFDAIGLWRDVIRRKAPKGKAFVSQPVEAKGDLPGGHSLEGIEGLKAYLMDQRKEQFTRALVSKLASYALGRSVEFGDEHALDELTEQFASEGYQLRPLIHATVQSELFQTK